jgi:hypothetical protein
MNATLRGLGKPKNMNVEKLERRVQGAKLLRWVFLSGEPIVTSTCRVFDITPPKGRLEDE